MTRSNNCANVQVLAMHRLLCDRLFRPKKRMMPIRLSIWCRYHSPPLMIAKLG